MNWQFDNSIPIYTQLVYKFRLAIACGEFLPGEKLPAVRDISSQAGVNPNTMQRAFQELDRLGLVYTQRTNGRHVTEDTRVIEMTKVSLAQEHIDGFLRSMQELGFDREQIIQMIENSKEDINGTAGM